MFLVSLFCLSVFADTFSAATANSGEYVALSSNIRTVYSKKIEFKALPLMRFLQFAQIQEELNTTPGMTISMLLYDNMTLGGALTEGTNIVIKNLSSSTKSITVSEQGNALGFTEMLLHSSFDNIMETAVTLLSRDMAMTLDTQLRDCALTNTNKVYGYTAAGVTVALRSDLTTDMKMRMPCIRDAVEILVTNNAMKFNADAYMCGVHPHQGRALREDTAWLDVVKYGDPTRIYYGEIGRIEDVRFFETTLMCNGKAAATDPSYKLALHNQGVGSAFDVYQAVMLAENAYGLARALPVQLRDNGVVDFGRKRALAWYAIWGSALLHNEYAVTIETI